MYNTLLRLYKEKRVTDAGLAKAVALIWISEEEKVKIIASVSTQ